MLDIHIYKVLLSSPPHQTHTHSKIINFNTTLLFDGKGVGPPKIYKYIKSDGHSKIVLCAQFIDLI